MKYLHFPPELAQTPIRLTKDELKEPATVIEEFFSFYDLNQVRLELGNWLEYALGSDDENMKSGINRINLLQFSYQLEALVEAVYILDKNRVRLDAAIEKIKSGYGTVLRSLDL